MIRAFLMGLVDGASSAWRSARPHLEVILLALLIVFLIARCDLPRR